MVEVLPAVPVTAASLRPAGQLGERRGPVLDGQAARAGGRELGVALADRAGHDDRGGRVGQVRRVVADVDLGAERPQREHGGRLTGVGAGHPLAAGEQDAGDPAHPGSADADEVDGHAASPPVCLRVRPTSSTRWARRSAASACPDRRAAAPIAASRAGSVSSGDELGEHPVAGELGVGHQHAPARGDDRSGVERLLTVAVRQRDVDGGQAHGRHLRDGHRPAPAEHGVGRGVGQVHRVDVGQPDVAGPRRGGAARFAVGVQDGDPGLREPGQRRGERRVERARALRAAEDEQHRPLGGQPEPLPGPRPQGRSVQLGDRAAQRDAEDLRVGKGAGHGGGDAGREPGADPVGEARPRVGLVHDDRHAAAGAEVGGQGDVAAEPDDDVGVDLGEHLPHPADGRAHPTGQAQEVGAGLARQRDRRDQLQRVAARRDEGGVQAAIGAEGRDRGTGSSRRTASASASAGSMWPALPPPATTTFMRHLLSGNECSSTRFRSRVIGHPARTGGGRPGGRAPAAAAAGAWPACPARGGAARRSPRARAAPRWRASRTRTW